MAKTQEVKHHNTGIMNKMRDKMPIIIIFLIVAFLITIVFEWGMNLIGLREDKQLFAKINGEDITYQQYEQQVQQQVEQMRQQNQGKDIDDATMQQIRDQVWSGLVSQTLAKQQMKKMGITVTDAEVLDWIYNRPESLPDPIKKNFMDSTGTFNMGFYQQALTMKTKEATQFWGQVEQYVREVLQSNKLQAIVTEGVRVTEGEVLQKYKDDKILANFTYVPFDLSMVTDTMSFQVNDAEMKKYYDDHKDEFKQEEAVKFKYVTFSDAATMEDSNATKNILNAYKKDLQNTLEKDSALIKYVNDNSVTPYNDAFQKPSALGNDALKFLFTAKPGDVSDVIVGTDGYKLIRLLDEKDGDETYSNASHVLINFGTDTLAAKKKAEDILARIRKGEDINTLAEQLSDDPSAKQNKGDLGWFGKGAMVKEFEDAVLNAKDGEIVGPVKTQFGFHIIKVNKKSKKEFKVAEIKKPVIAGARTKEQAKKKAEDFYYTLDKGADMDTLAKQYNLTAAVTPDVSKDGFVPGAGQNKSLIKFGLSNKVDKIDEPIKVQGGYGVYKIIGKVSEGYKNFDSIKTTLIKPKVVNEKKFAVLKKMAEDVKSKIGGDLMNAKNFGTYTAETADSVSMSKPNQKIGQELALYQYILNDMKEGEISPPVKGARGYYLIKLNSITPFNNDDYLKEADQIRTTLLNQKKQSVVQDWLNKIQNDADITDNRDKFYN
ncbi:peptidylprolyl isomerase [soil metagenome]